jgi:methyl-accepting chemotaxis protein
MKADAQLRADEGAETHLTSELEVKETNFDATLQQLAHGLSQFGVEMVDVAGSIESSSAATAELNTAFETLNALAQRTEAQTEKIRGNVTSTAMVVEQSNQSMDESRQAVGKASSDISRLIEAVSEINRQLQGLQGALASVADVSKSIDQIARQTNLLALNATIEAARAGEAGRGFAVVAGEVKQLAGETSNATQEIQLTLDRLNNETLSLLGLGENALNNVSDVQGSTAALEAVVDELSTTINEIGQASNEVQTSLGEIEDSSEELVGQVGGMRVSINDIAGLLDTASGRIGEAVDQTDQLVGVTADSGVASDEGRFLNIARSVAGQIEAAFEKEISEGRATPDDLFDRDYRPIEGSDPEQVMTRFTELTDRVLPALQEPVLGLDDRIVFCAAVDDNGYLPTHNRKFSQPQGADPVWNAANCRNRRIFADKVGLRAGQSTAPFLMQSYRRDMGGGQFVIMKDLSVPLTVRGRHWGGFRLAYKV